jgi:hypothetical protein
VGVVRCDAAGNCVMVQREMETGRSPLVSIARASAGTERADCNWLQKEIMVAIVGAHGAPDTEIDALRPLGLTAETHARSERTTA